MELCSSVLLTVLSMYVDRLAPTSSTHARPCVLCVSCGFVVMSVEAFGESTSRGVPRTSDSPPSAVSPSAVPFLRLHLLPRSPNHSSDGHCFWLVPGFSKLHDEDLTLLVKSADQLMHLVPLPPPREPTLNNKLVFFSRAAATGRVG